jgi:hypothetical protein
MSEPILAEISIGGRIHRELAGNLLTAIRDQRVSLEWGDARFEPQTPEELLWACQVKEGVRVLWLCDDQANYGEFRQLEAFLVGAGIAFDRRSNATFQFDAEVVQFRPGMSPVKYPSDSSGRPFVPAALMASIAKALDQAADTAEGQTSLELLRRLRGLQQLVHEHVPRALPPLAAFEIVK